MPIYPNSQGVSKKAGLLKHILDVQNNPSLINDPDLFKRLMIVMNNNFYTPKEKYQILVHLNSDGFDVKDENGRTLGLMLLQINKPLTTAFKINSKLSSKQFVTLLKKCNLMKAHSVNSYTDHITFSKSNFGSHLIFRALYNNHLNDIYLKPTHWVELIKSCQPLDTDSTQFSLGMGVASLNLDAKLNLNPQQLISIFETDNPQTRTDQNLTLSMIVCSHNKRQNLNLTPKVLSKIFLNSNLQVVDAAQENLAIKITKHHKKEDLNLTNDVLFEIFNKSDINQNSKMRFSLSAAIANQNSHKGLNLTNHQLTQLFQKIDTQNKHGELNSLHFIAACNCSQKLNFDFESYSLLLQKLDKPLSIDEIQKHLGIFYIFNSNQKLSLEEINEFVDFNHYKEDLYQCLKVIETSTLLLHNNFDYQHYFDKLYIILEKLNINEKIKDNGTTTSKTSMKNKFL